MEEYNVNASEHNHDIPQKLNRTQIIVGVVWLVVFIALIFLSAFYFNPKTFSWNNISGFLKSILPINSDKNTNRSSAKDLPAVFKQQIVQEESAIIDVVDKVSPAVVSIVIKNINFDYFSGPSAVQEGIGTGFIVDGKGVIVTNNHVVDQEGDYSVVLSSGETFEVQKINKDPTSDLAILEIDARDLPIADLGDSDSVKVGQRAIAIGNALGKYQNTVTVGVVSGVARELAAFSGFGGDVKIYEGAIQTDAALNPGNSGGPLLNSYGQVIGINVATTRGADNISFAIPVNTLKPILAGYFKEGRIIRPYFGVSYTMITKDLAVIRRLPVGAFIQRVILDSPAKKAGIERGDIITEIDGVKLEDGKSLSSIIARKQVGESVEIVLDRNGKELKVRVKLEEMPEKP